MRALAVALAIAAAFAASACGGGDDNDSEAADGCEEVDMPDPKSLEKSEPPTGPLNEGTTYNLVIETNCGNFTIELDQKSAPKATASLVTLARSGYFDDTIIHRVVPSFVIQGGDPTGTGRGGPGYKTVDIPPRGAKYTRGVVAMAKAADEPLGTAGSQFFVVTATDAGLPADYAIVGRVTAGLQDTIMSIDHLGDAQTERPTQTVLIRRIRVETA
jgi:peptidyl-prolyl cis-trans isomerase B (cyclophilin B)